MTMVLAPHKGAKTRVKAQQERGAKPQRRARTATHRPTSHISASTAVSPTSYAVLRTRTHRVTGACSRSLR